MSDDTVEEQVYGSGMFCDHCGLEKTIWVTCDWCGGEGFYDETETDPDGDEFTLCPDCDGRGGWWECGNIPHDMKETNDG